MSVSGFTSVINLWNLRCRVVSSSEFFAGQSGTITLEVNRRLPIPACFIRVEIGSSSKFLTFIRKREQLSIEISFERRGLVTIDKIKVSSSFPFYFFIRSKIIPENFSLVVYPKPIAVDISKSADSGDLNSESRLSKGKSFEGETVGVRAYDPLDPPKHIHWKASAKAMQLMTKEFAPYMQRPTVIDIDDFTGDIEQRLGKATYAILALSKKGIPVGLKLDSLYLKAETGAAHLRRLLHALALY